VNYPTQFLLAFILHVALRQKIAAQAIANLARINAIVLLFRRRDGWQHQRMRYLQRRSMWLQMIVDPAGKNSGLCTERDRHESSPRLASC